MTQREANYLIPKNTNIEAKRLADQDARFIADAIQDVKRLDAAKSEIKRQEEEAE
jgi:hypothetical protein